MGKREAKLLELLGPEAKDAESLIPRASTRLLPSNAKSEILSSFTELGGIQIQTDFAAGPWDLLYRGGVLLELDEEQHFNRYREASLEPWAGRLPWAGRYLRFSSDSNPNACARAAVEDIGLPRLPNGCLGHLTHSEALLEKARRGGNSGHFMTRFAMCTHSSFRAFRLLVFRSMTVSVNPSSAKYLTGGFSAAGPR